MVALHASRSAPSIDRFRRAFPDRRLVLVLSGTDLYRDLPRGGEALRSLERADRIVALQDDALAHVPASQRDKCTVIYQSAPLLEPLPKPTGRLDIAMVGHLREEKDPRTVWQSLDHLDRDLPVRIRHIGAALAPHWADEAREAMARDPRYRWTGPLAHGLARHAIRRAHVLLHPSAMEGGANVIVEAITSGTPVIASRVSGNVGMLGAGYGGYFEAGDAEGLARLVAMLVREPGRLASLQVACESRRGLFAPDRERDAVRALVAGIDAGAHC